MQGQSTCEYCGKRFDPNPHALRPQKYCDRFCRQNAQYYRARARAAARALPVPCACNCGETFQRGDVRSGFIKGHRARLPRRKGYGKPLADRFWPKVDMSGGPNACWLWTAGKDAHGYGMVGRGTHGAGNMKASHAAWQLVDGSVPAGLWILHTCDTPACVRNDEVGVYVLNGIAHPRRGHLWLGTAQDNIDDMWAKGRANPIGASGERSSARKHPEKYQGERNGRAKLTEQDVREIRARYAAGGVSQQAIADDYGVNQRMISFIVRRVSWLLVA